MRKGETGGRRAYIRMPIILAMWGGTVLVILGTALLFSFFPQVDWHVCAALTTCLFLAFFSLLVHELWGQKTKRTGTARKGAETPMVETENNG